MTSKACIVAPWLLLLAAAGCAPQSNRLQHAPIPTQTAVVAPTPVRPQPQPRPAPPRRPHAKSAPTPTPAPAAPVGKTSYSTLPSMITDRVSWTDQGRSMAVVRDAAAADKTVPLFRQAIVLGQVRSALADSEAAPAATFGHGALTLDFSRGSAEEIAAAVNKALAIPEVGNVQILLPH